MISGPVESDKNSRLEEFLDALNDSRFARDGFTNGGPVVAFRHPKDDKADPQHIGKHQVHVTDSVEEIFNRVGSNTGTVLFAGVSHYDSEIAQLIDALARSNRQVVAAGLNLDMQGRPYGSMEDVIAFADRVMLAKGICFRARGYGPCTETEVSRSVQLGPNKYAAACVQHALNPYLPPVSPANLGKLTLDVGSMFSGKSSGTKSRRKILEKCGINPVNFRYLSETERYGCKVGELFGVGQISYHDRSTTDAINVRTGEHIEKFLEKYDGDSRFIMIDEGQFIEGLYETAQRLVEKGHQLHVNMLLRTFNRQGFMVAPSLMCLADKISFHYATCVNNGCGRPATESQRMVVRAGETRMEPANYFDPVEMIAGNDPTKIDRENDRCFYQASCLPHLEIPGEPKGKYEFNIFKAA